MKYMKIMLFLAVMLLFILVIVVLPVSDSMKHGDFLPLATVIIVPLGFLFYAFIKNEERKQSEKNDRRRHDDFI